MGKLKIAVLGAGYWASLQIPSWQAAGAEVVAIWNRTREKAALLAERFGIKHVYDTAEELFEHADFDLADVITNPESHKRLVLTAASYKKPVVCQKPMATSLEDSREMSRACREAGIWFAIHENFRYREAWRRVGEIIRGGGLGRVIRAEITLCSASADGLRLEPALAKLGHMALLDMGPHVFDLTRLLFGEALSVYCRDFASRPENGVLDTAIALLDMRGGACVKCEICNDKGPSAFVSAENGVLAYDAEHYITVNVNGYLHRYEPPAFVRPEFIPEASWQNHGGDGMLSIRRCNEGIMESFLGGRPAATDGEYSLKTAELVFKAIGSAETNAVSFIEGARQ